MRQCLITLPDMVTTYAPVYGIGDLVRLKIRASSEGGDARGMVTGYIVRPCTVSYLVTFASASESTHYDFELEGFDE